MSRCKNWCFTSFNVDSPPKFDPITTEYLCYGRETCPTTKKSHLQGFICLKERKRLAGVKKLLGSVHLEASRGTVDQNIQYCSKDGEFTEFGSRPSSGPATSPFALAIAAATDGRLDDVKSTHPGIYLRYKKTLESLQKFRSDDLDGSCGVWICGPPRIGKDYAVRKIGNVYCKALNKWWDGYLGEPNVLISDVEPDHFKWIGYFLKIWSDRYPFIAEIKGSSMKIRPEKIFVTSNFRLSDCCNGEILGALQSRFTIYDMFDNVVRKRPVVAASTCVFDLLVENGDACLEKENVPPAVQEAVATTSKQPTRAEEEELQDFQVVKKKPRKAKSS
ncbi:replication-associated protein [Dragonfly circularisvirus]|uniref:Replication-associated protein n=1 Tax=Dragonfly circularisvirus TaxID=1234872 RepID=K0A2Q4_9VIRU|nr:replication-associated protein [Dragonfly circularisvirus]AFS65297.1 replication-associated protein [Dragonfly circularisvirus]